MRIIVIAIAAGLSIVAAAQVARPPTQPEFFKSTAGEDLFKFYCAGCHGLDAKGRPATPAMRTPSSDLTALAAANGGVFPRARVEAILAHGSVSDPAHGPKDMPVWGAIFRGTEANATLVQIRIEHLVQYLESLQGSGGRRGAE
jgi:mono/diheme cytochrome c family protein